MVRKINHEKNRARAAAHHKKHRENGTSITGWLEKQFKDVPCSDCSGVFPFIVMDFDHRPEETKCYGISTKGTRVATPKNISEIMKEVDKCDLICSNCHRIKTKSRYK
jgi:hypothetical protein